MDGADVLLEPTLLTTLLLEWSVAPAPSSACAVAAPTPTRRNAPTAVTAEAARIRDTLDSLSWKCEMWRDPEWPLRGAVA
ncbi:hypothetical protein ACWC9T_24280 [Kitasatospora sp. NPDC001159]